jgi:acyl-CoA synthetase (AMP-forming)/AMP-acid ligase II
VAEALAAAGVSRGDRVGMALPDGLANVVTFLAASMAGTAAHSTPRTRKRSPAGDRCAMEARSIVATCCICAPENLAVVSSSASETSRMFSTR